tara:strand:- start:1158 stop:1346 length:189 start_codon:yes stop_codon:yes gene_type:complete
MNSLEDTIRKIQKQYKNRPSPLAGLHEHKEPTLPNVQQYVKPAEDIRSGLLSGFKPNNDTFR